MRQALKQEVEEKKKGFDLTVTHRHPKSGEIIKRTPYNCHVVEGEAGAQRKLFERPPGSGNVYDPNGNEIGRWVLSDKTKKFEFREGEPHIKWSEPETGDQKLAREYAETKAENDALKRELAAHRAERDSVKQPVQTQKSAAPAKNGQGA